MLIRITRHCEGGCSHCMMDAEPDGRHMDQTTFAAVLDYIPKIDPIALLVTGGEPFDHPNAFDFIKAIASQHKHGPEAISVISNGIALEKDTDLLDRVLALGVTIQVTNDPRYYPKRVSLPVRERLYFYDELWAPIYPAGRALTNGLKSERQSPGCFNMRSASLSGYFSNVKLLIRFLEVKGRHCIPAIDFDGTIKLGETAICQTIATVYDEPEKLFLGTMACRCNNCCLIDNLPESHKKAISML